MFEDGNRFYDAFTPEVLDNISGPQQPIEQFSQELAAAAQRMRDEAANEAAGRQGMMGPKKSAGSLDGSPLFGSKQQSLF